MPEHIPVWFVVAASSGFGREVAIKALERGHTVVATARKADRIQDLADAGAHIMTFDVTSPASDIDAVAQQVFKQHSRIDYLVNTAGYVLEGAAEEVSPQEIYECFNTNVFGIMNTLRVFLPRIREQPLAPDGIRSTILTFGSLASWKSGASYSVYAMTKSCASSLAESLREELSPFKIRATAVEPGYFRTSFLKPGVIVKSQHRIAAYDDEQTPSGQLRKQLSIMDGNQPGDVSKGANVIVDVVTGSGAADGQELPLRIVLGSDCYTVVREKCSQTLAILDQWDDIIKSTDHV